MKPNITITPPGPKARRLIARDKRVTSPSLPRCYPFAVSHGKGDNLWDIDGNRYLDFNSNIAVANAGHSNPHILNAIKRQLFKLTHGALLTQYPELPISFSEKLVKLMPKGLDMVFLGNSGADSIEAAMKLARYHNHRRYFLAFSGCFHGRSYGALSLTISKPVYRDGFGPFLDAVHAPYPYAYRHPSNDPEECVRDCVVQLEALLKKVGSKNVCAIFVEPIEGEGGYIVPPKSFFKELRRICDAHDILLVDDEVQAGCMRTGKFLAIEHFDVKPDVVCLAKALGGGLPLGATVTRKEFMRWPSGSHASTFGGNLLSCAAGIEALNILSDKRLGKKVTNDGKHVLKRMREVQEESKLLGDVRGLGLMVGLEFVKNKKTKEYATKERDEIVQRLFKKGVLVLPAGHSTIRLAPPLTISRDDLDSGLDIIADVVSKAGQEVRS
ncbi:aminotransferase class III-fold pyridoxal phosphate-dependent enzyme [Candidatus Woesearchaeota archaeon]|nr:aminotransferase class III-fold pyridoxal phosphate-dependent enzyme [Candidatus Woesearchaeota archaeon]